MTITCAPMEAKMWRVLVIDDSPDDRADIRRLLLKGSERRYDLTEAETGAAGLRAVLEADDLPDCVVLDYNLPDMNAVEVLAALAGPDGLTACPVVVLTGSVGHEHSRAVLQAGAQDYLGKGWMTPESLTRAVENAAERWGMAREMRQQLAALKTSEERLRLAISGSDLGTWHWDILSGALDWSERCLSMFGIPARTVMSYEKFLGALHPEDRASADDAVQHALQSGSDYQIELRNVWPDESVHWTISLGRPYFDAAGVPTRMEGIAFDITDRKQAEQAMAERTSLLNGVLEGTTDVMFAKDLNGRLLLANAACAAVFSATPKQVLGKTTEELCPPDLAAAVRQHDKAVIAGGSAIQLEETFQMAGEPRTFLTLKAPLRDGGGRVIGLLGISRDITERKRVEATLRQSEARLSGILRQSPAGIVQTDATGCMTLVNPRWCEMLGHPEAELLGRNILEITHPSFEAPTAAAFGRVAAGGPDFQIEKVYSRKDGTVLHAQSNVAAIRSPNGDFLGIIAVVLDISERIRSEKELARVVAELSEADRRKDVFLATLAHELRNPLAPLRNGLQVLKLSNNNGAAVERVRAMMDRQVSLLVRLVDDLLDVSRINQGKVDLRKERVELRAVIDAAVETSRTEIEQAGHDLAIVIPDEPILLDGDATRLAQAVSNLLNNSAKYTHRGGRIRLTVRRERGMAVVSVKDDGIGIPPAMIGRVFEMFTQVDRTLEKTTGGLGIGLSLVKGLMEMHGGTIEAKSDGEGLGSEFVARLPVVMSVVDGPERPNGQTSEVAPSTLRRILVVDDNVDAAESLGQLLEMLGNEVRTANDGEAGIAAAAQFRPDVVLMDIGMPKLNGYEAARRIRQHSWGQGMLLVALTGWGQEDDQKKSADAGFNHHLVKPVTLDDLTKLMSA